MHRWVTRVAPAFATFNDLDADVSMSEFGVEGMEWNATGYLYYRFEDGLPWSLAGMFTKLPVRFPLSDARSGRYLKVMAAWTLSAAQQRQVGRPRITRIDCLPVQKPATGTLLPQTPVVV